MKEIFFLGKKTPSNLMESEKDTGELAMVLLGTVGKFCICWLVPMKIASDLDALSDRLLNVNQESCRKVR